MYQQDGSVRRFEMMEVHAQMFLARMDFWKDTTTNSEVVAAVRNATPESRREFEEKFGSIVRINYLVGSRQEGGWIEAKTRYPRRAGSNGSAKEATTRGPPSSAINWLRRR